MEIERRIEINNFLRTFTQEEKEHIFSFLQSERKLEEPEMNYEQAKKFEQIEMPFGLYKGQKIKDVEFSYLCNLLDPNPFMKKLRAYLKYCNSSRHRS